QVRRVEFVETIADKALIVTAGAAEHVGQTLAMSHLSGGIADDSSIERDYGCRSGRFRLLLARRDKEQNRNPPIAHESPYKPRSRSAPARSACGGSRWCRRRCRAAWRRDSSARPASP